MLLRRTTPSQPCQQRVRRTAWALLFLIIATAVSVQRSAPAAAAAPPNFSDTLVTPVELPTALAFTPDGRMLITSQPGRLRVYQNNSLIDPPALDLSAMVCSNVERGLLGVAVDPDFATNHFIYVYYTFKKF